MTNPDGQGGGAGFVSGPGLGWTLGDSAQLVTHIAAEMVVHKYNPIFFNPRPALLLNSVITGNKMLAIMNKQLTYFCIVLLY